MRLIRFIRDWAGILWHSFIPGTHCPECALHKQDCDCDDVTDGVIVLRNGATIKLVKYDNDELKGVQQ